MTHEIVRHGVDYAPVAGVCQGVARILSWSSWMVVWISEIACKSPSVSCWSKSLTSVLRFWLSLWRSPSCLHCFLWIVWAGVLGCCLISIYSCFSEALNSIIGFSLWNFLQDILNHLEWIVGSTSDTNLKYMVTVLLLLLVSLPASFSWHDIAWIAQLV